MTPRSTGPQFRIPWRTVPRIRAELDTELQFHLDMRTEELIATGMNRDDARREAQREFGDLAYTRRYCEPDRLVAVDENNVPAGARYSDVSAAEYLDWTAATRAFDGIATAGQRSLTYAEGPAPVQIPGRRVSANYFDVLGVVPALGRTF